MRQPGCRRCPLGAYLDITDLLADNAPGLLELIPAGYWDACRVGGRIYGVPTYKDTSITQYFVWDVELLKELGMEEASHELPHAGGRRPRS